MQDIDRVQLIGLAYTVLSAAKIGLIAEDEIMGIRHLASHLDTETSFRAQFAQTVFALGNQRKPPLDISQLPCLDSHG